MILVNKSGCWQLGLVSVLLISEAMLSASSDYLLAQIVPDRTLGNESSAVAPNAEVKGLPAFLIEGGATRGSNLFHSFTEFNVGELQRVYFANPTGIENILSRVTGSNVSQILGTLGIDGSANLFFLNPNGIIFGENAQLDVAGSFVGSTANSFVFPDGSEFSAVNPQVPPLLTINLTPGLQYGLGATISNRGNLAVGQDLTLSAGNLDLQGQLYAGQDLKLFASDTVQILDSATNPFIAVADNQLLVQGNQGITILALNHPASGFFSGGDMVLRSAMPVVGDTYYWTGGNFRIEQLDRSLGNLSSLYDPIIRSQGDVSFQNYQGASLHILAGGSVNIGSVTINGTDSENSLQETVNLSDGTTQVAINRSNQPTLDIRAGTKAVETPLGITGSPIPTELSFDTNNNPTANIAINSIKVTQPNGLVFLTNQYQPNTATSGEIQVREILTNDNFGGFSGNSGNVIMDSRGDITLPSFATINTSSATGNAGDVYLIANQAISLANNSFIISGTNGNGRGGNINIQARILSLTDNAAVASNTLSLGQGGNLTVTTSELVELTGTSNLQAATGGFGDAGDLTIVTGKLMLRDGSQLLTSTLGAGKGGNLTVTASELVNFKGTSVNGQLASGLFAETRSSGNAGNLNIETGKLIVTDGAAVSTSTFSEGKGGDLTVIASETVELLRTLTDAQFPTGLFASTFGMGDAGNLMIRTGKLILQEGTFLSVGAFKENPITRIQVDNFSSQAGDLNIIATELVELSGISGQWRSQINSDTQGEGDAGDVRINTAKLIVRDGAFVSTGTSGGGSGGSLTVTASDSVELLGVDGQFATGLFSEAARNAAGNGGDLTINTEKFIARNGGYTSTSSFSEARAGNLTVNAAESVELIGTGIIGENQPENVISSGLFSGTRISQQVPNITINTRRLVIKDGGQVNTGQRFPDSEGIANAGNLTVNASESIEIIGVSANELFSSRLDSTTTGSGNAGDLTLNTKQLILRNGGQVSVSTFSNGNAGNLIVNASESVKIIGIEPVGSSGLTTGIFAQATGSEGNGGNIKINTRSLVITEGGEIITRTAGGGKAGNITLKVAENLNITGKDTGIFADTDQGSTGDGGSIFIDPVENIVLQDAASIAVNSQGSGEGGNIELQAGSLTLDQGTITAETASNQGGSINLKLFDLLTLRNNSQISATAGTARTPQAEGDGGNIDINAEFILSFPDENKITAKAFLGTGGNINITTNSILGREFLDLNVSSELGLEGTVSINTLELELSPGLVELPSKLETPPIPQGCEASRGRGSSLINTGRGGLPPSPTESLSTHQVWKDVQLPTQLIKNSANTVNHSNTTPERILEATGWIINEAGIVELVAEESSDTHQDSCR